MFLPLFREKETEASEVILLIVGFHLGKIGVQGQIQRQLGVHTQNCACLSCLSSVLWSGRRPGQTSGQAQGKQR